LLTKQLKGFAATAGWKALDEEVPMRDLAPSAGAGNKRESL
jgi:hypothetical protein